MAQDVLLTIVIPVLNQVRYIAECLESMRVQLDDDIEVLVRDAESTDGTLEIINSNADILSHIHVGRDGGQSDAIDQGFTQARGKYLTWLNADDVLLPGALDSVRSFLEKHPDSEWLVGDTALIDSEGIITGASRAGPCVAAGPLRRVITYSPSAVFSKRLYEEVGGLDLSFHYKMDTDLWNRFARAGRSYSRAKHHWWGFREHEASKTTAHHFTGAVFDPYSSSQFRQHAEEQELFLRHQMYSGSLHEFASAGYARVLRLLDLSAPLQVIDVATNRGRHWRNFRRFSPWV